MSAFYNENDRRAAMWLRRLIAHGHIAPGVVDERSITDIDPNELYEYTQCHFFAGIGGWSLALRLAGWPDDRRVWTGSCPCQPFSQIGAAREEEDERHLWPAFRGHIEVCQPAVVFGEQVASPAGRAWLAGVRVEMEAMGYAVGGADLCAPCCGAPDIRPRLYWMGYADQRIEQHGKRKRAEKARATSGGKQGRAGSGVAVLVQQAAGWRDFRAVSDGSGRLRRVAREPGVLPLAHGLSASVVRMSVRGYGNAIKPDVAAQFIAAAMECIDERRPA